MKIITVDDGKSEKQVFTKVLGGRDIVWDHYEDVRTVRSAIKAGKLDDADLIILDVQLKDNDEGGVRLAETLHARNPETRIVVLSVCQAQETVCACFRNGAYGYFLKPGDDEDLEKTVESLVVAAPRARRCLPEHAGS